MDPRLDAELAREAPQTGLLLPAARDGHPRIAQARECAQQRGVILHGIEVPDRDQQWTIGRNSEHAPRLTAVFRVYRRRQGNPVADEPDPGASDAQRIRKE